MIPYTLINRRGKAETWRAYNPDDGAASLAFTPFGARAGDYLEKCFISSAESGVIHPDQRHVASLEHTKMQFLLQGKVVIGLWTFNGGHHLVITKWPDKRMFVSIEDGLKAIHAEMHKIPLPKSVGSGNGNQVLGQVLSIALGLLGGLTGAFATAIPGARVLSGDKLALGLTNALLTQTSRSIPGGSDDGPPPSPSITEIKAAVESVIQEDTAKKAAVLFSEAYDDFSSLGRQMVEVGTTAPAALYRRFTTFVDGALDPTDDSTFAGRLALMRDSPDMAKWILPEYLNAIGLYLVLTRIRFAATWIEGEDWYNKPIPASAVNEYLKDVEQLSAGLTDAVQKFLEIRAGLVAKTGLEGTPEQIVPIRYVSQEYLGSQSGLRDAAYDNVFPGGTNGSITDFTFTPVGAKNRTTIVGAGAGYGTQPDPIADGQKYLETIIAGLKSDLTTVAGGGWPQNLLNISLPTT